MRFNQNNTLCLEYNEFTQIVPKGTYDSLKARGSIKVHGRGGYGVGVLIEYDTLPKRYQDEVKKVFGDPYQYITTQPIKDLLIEDLKAEQFYRDYSLPNGLKLPDQDFDVKGKPVTNYVKEYAIAASWLNNIINLTENKKALKDQLNISVAVFWERIMMILKADGVRLPASERRLKDAIKRYKSNGYEALIEVFRFGNTNSRKVNSETAEALLLELLAHDHQHDYTRVANAYNEWATANNHEQITDRAVSYWAAKYKHLITEKREGKAKNYNRFNKQILRSRPSAPLLLINSDDNVLDLYFVEEKVNKKTGYAQKNYYYRPVMYVVMDAFNDYILGYAIGETVTIELVKEAYRNAENHVKQLLNGYYLPHQIQTDRWGLSKGGELEQFYQSMATYTPATAKVAQGKYIERAFGVNWHQTLKSFINYAGQNITAKERLSPEAIERNRSNFPPKEKAPEQIALFIEMLRKLPNQKTGVSRQEEWLNSINEKSKARAISAEKHLQIFGVLHKPRNGGKNRLLPAGLELMDRRFVYDIPAFYFPEHVNKAVNVIYDPYDMSQVLVTDGKGLRFVAHEYERSPSCIADHTKETRQLWHQRIEEKKIIAAVPAKEAEKRRTLLERAAIDAESLLQGSVLIKQIRHTAEKAITGAIENFDQSQLTETTKTNKKAAYGSKW
ncbi:hypothetical protein [Pedobacter sp. SL55]|uniref:hypothetical protein n=1 Tax=Pedobacter sp. SL55 TaxID=2995161 RepID=UPI00226FFBE6|nr:hypothetical protein [Pedobacter sp. SL55]WAC40550.1 hypothetical protein OVA16_18595 [Pedobacter sp. SL55]